MVDRGCLGCPVSVILPPPLVSNRGSKNNMSKIRKQREKPIVPGGPLRTRTDPALLPLTPANPLLLCTRTYLFLCAFCLFADCATRSSSRVGVVLRDRVVRQHLRVPFLVLRERVDGRGHCQVGVRPDSGGGQPGVHHGTHPGRHQGEKKRSSRLLCLHTCWLLPPEDTLDRFSPFLSCVSRRLEFECWIQNQLRLLPSLGVRASRGIERCLLRPVRYHRAHRSRLRAHVELMCLRATRRP